MKRLWKLHHGDTVFAKLGMGHAFKGNFFLWFPMSSIFCSEMLQRDCIFSIIQVTIMQIAIVFLISNRMYLQSQLHIKTR
jgi:hypothetical protein